MRLHLVCDHSACDAITDGGVALVLDRQMLPELEARRIETYFVDDLLDWTTRAEIEREVAGVLDQLRMDERLAEVTIEGYNLAASARYDIRIGATDVLRTIAAIRTIPEASSWTPPSLNGCPLGATLGARAALGAFPEASSSAAPRAAIPKMASIANRILRMASVLRSKPEARVVAFPGGKVLDALQAIDGRALRSLPLAVAAFPGLVAGGAARLSARGIPAVVAHTRPTSGTRSPLVAAVPTLAAEPAVDAALRAVVGSALARTAKTVAETAQALETLEPRGWRSVVLPTTSGPTATVVREWARRRNLVCAVVQHGIYGFRDWDDGDQDADVLLAWGPGVQSQFPSAQEVRIVGAPGVPEPHRGAARDGRRILIVTTNAPLGSALGTHGFCEDFIRAVAAGLPALLDTGYTVTLRPHPTESRERYKRMLGPLAGRVSISTTRSFAKDADASDFVIGSASSATFEAAALQLPVALWLGGLPLAVRASFLLPPLDGELPATFNSPEDFVTLADSLARRDGVALDEMQALARRLRHYAVPFQPDRFADEISTLAT
jgi:hypothetical protein